MKVVIPGSGLASRMGQHTAKVPKTMLTLGNKPILEWIILKCKKYGITEFAVSVLGDYENVIRSHFGSGERFGVDLKIISSDEPLGTAGSVWAVRKWLDSAFIVYYGDIISNVNLENMISFHLAKKGIATLALMKSPRYDVGFAQVVGSKISNFVEKPFLNGTVNMGIYVMNPNSINYVEKGSDFADHIFPKMLKNGENLFGFISDTYWFHIEDYCEYKLVDFLVSKGFLNPRDDRA
ncbi:NDP-sugar synthase [Candidatus Bathyarchaeota archaeon]|nr:NDP-sugar synthase [Candidatus Bathyarchaeota archaeon]